ncbi:transposase [Bathymodiolus japonicus methanotrophic gill symbiont]|uniref:transposase n=1 Tax=Bathymodiolus japonicus methanotrophic gill symbiont TaxID=113269 RepID=UPI001C8E0BD8|nr:transposase [Bathymodiolus japonicus methanotrophic gill symbiont]
MLMNAPATFIQSYIDDLNDALNQLKLGAALTRIQAAWLGTCLTGILLMNSVCWAKFERASLGDCKVAVLSRVFRKASIPWDWLLRVSVVLILKRYGITEGVLAFDESDRARSKSTKRIYKVYKQKHKGSGGYVNGQTIVLLLLVTSSITVPVGFFFYMPDPALKQWDKEDKRLKKSGIAKKDRPIKPERDSAYPTKTEIALGLLKEFKVAHSLIKIKGVLADALYGEKAFMDEAASGSRYFCESLFWASQPKQAAKT